MHSAPRLGIGSLIFAIGMFASTVHAAEQQQSSPAEGDTVHVLVGKSVLVNVQAPMKRVLAVMQGEEFHTAVSRLPGYRSQDAGIVKTVKEVFQRLS